VGVTLARGRSAPTMPAPDHSAAQPRRIGGLEETLMQAGRWMVGLGLVAVLIASPAPADEFKVDAETREAARAAIDKGIEFLKSSQSPEGGWVAFRGADPAISALAAKCFAQHPDYGPQHE